MAQYADCCNVKISGASVIGKENGWWVIPGIWQIIECVYFHLIHLSFCSPICLLILGWLDGQAMQCNVKIILHRIISVVWLTNFPSEIRRLTSPRWWAVPLFPEREKARGPAFSWEPHIDDRLPLLRALAKEKKPAEWLLIYFKLGSLKILHIQEYLKLFPP